MVYSVNRFPKAFISQSQDISSSIEVGKEWLLGG